MISRFKLKTMVTTVKEEVKEKEKFDVGDLVISKKGTVIKVTNFQTDKLFCGIILFISDERYVSQFETVPNWYVENFEYFRGKVILENLI